MLAGQQVGVIAVVRRKEALVAAAAAQAKGGKLKFAWQREFDSMMVRLFKDRLHLAAQSSIVVANRGSSDRTLQLKRAVETARSRFELKWGVFNPHKLELTTGSPKQHAGLQAVDYYLWALQRVYEKGEFDLFQRHQDAYRVIVDVDGTRAGKASAYFGLAKPLTPSTLKPFET